MDKKNTFPPKKGEPKPTGKPVIKGEKSKEKKEEKKK